MGANCVSLNYLGQQGPCPGQLTFGPQKMFPTGFPKKEASRQLCTNRKVTRGEGWLERSRKHTESRRRMGSERGERKKRGRPRTPGRSKSGPGRAPTRCAFTFQLPVTTESQRRSPRALPSATPAKKEKNKKKTATFGPRGLAGPNKGRRERGGSVPRPPARQRGPRARAPRPLPEGRPAPRPGAPPAGAAAAGRGRGRSPRPRAGLPPGLRLQQDALLLTPGTRGRRGSRCDPRGGAGEGAGGRAEPAGCPQPPASPAAAAAAARRAPPSPPPHAAAARVVRAATRRARAIWAFLAAAEPATRSAAAASLEPPRLRRGPLPAARAAARHFRGREGRGRPRRGATGGRRLRPRGAG